MRPTYGKYLSSQRTTRSIYGGTPRIGGITLNIYPLSLPIYLVGLGLFALVDAIASHREAE